jgi:hypothetical protein
MLPHNQPYYDGMIQRAGFIKACDFFAFQLKIDQFNPNDKIVRVNRLLAERSSITLRNGNLKRFEYDAEVIRQIYNDAFSNHWGFTPISREDFDFMAKDLKTILDPDLVLIAEHQGEAVGFLLAVPNINQALYKIRNGKLYPLGIFKLLYYFKRINSFRVMLLGIKRKYQHLGLGSMFYLKLFENTFQSKFRNVEISWVAETNHTMLAAAKLLGAERVKTYRLYDKLI